MVETALDLAAFTPIKIDGYPYAFSFSSEGKSGHPTHSLEKAKSERSGHSKSTPERTRKRAPRGREDNVSLCHAQASTCTTERL